MVTLVTNYALSATNTITFTVAPINNAEIIINLIETAIEGNYGGYQYTSLNDVINNFMVCLHWGR